MARYLAPSPAARAAAQRALSGIETIAVLENPNGKTISARRMGTCPISGDKIHPGDSITKTDEGWALTEHVGGLSNPRSIKKGKGKFKQTPWSVAAEKQYFHDAGTALHYGDPAWIREVESMREPKVFKQVENPGLGGAAMRYAKKHGVSLKEAWRAVKGGAKENPSKGGAAMKYARTHGVSLKQGWAAVKAGKANPGKEFQVRALARQIEREWTTINPNARSALYFMLNPNAIRGGDTTDHVVASFLANATSWRGDTARRIKAQLNALLR